jgi:hypothetical protein
MRPVKSATLLLKIEARVHADYDRAYERGDIDRGLRHADRICTVEHRILTNEQGDVSTYSDFN